MWFSISPSLYISAISLFASVFSYKVLIQVSYYASYNSQTYLFNNHTSYQYYSLSFCVFFLEGSSLPVTISIQIDKIYFNEQLALRPGQARIENNHLVYVRYQFYDKSKFDWFTLHCSPHPTPLTPPPPPLGPLSIIHLFYYSKLEPLAKKSTYFWLIVVDNTLAYHIYLVSTVDY